MSITAKSIYVKAPAEQVWDYLQAAKNVADWWPNCAEACEHLPGNGCCVEFTEKVSGVILRGQVEDIVREPGEGVTLHLYGDFCGDLTWRVNRENGGTRVVLESDYALPLARLAGHMSPMAVFLFGQREAEAMLARVGEHFNGNHH